VLSSILLVLAFFAALVDFGLILASFAGGGRIS